MVRVAIIGSGVIGRQWAMIFASGGHQVALYDVVPDQVETALLNIKERLQELQASGDLRGTLTAEEQMSLINGSGDLSECVTGAVHVQECAPENLELKRKVFQGLLEVVSDGNTAICSSTSCLPISQIVENLDPSRAAQCLVAHPINPPYFLPLVEVIPGPTTKPGIVQSVLHLLQQCQQQPVTLHKEVQGFAINRLQYALINESWRLVQEGVMSPSDVDKVMVYGLGPRYAFYGPFAVMQLNADGIEDYCQRFAGGMRLVNATYGAAPTYDEQPARRDIAAEMSEQLPLDQIPLARLERENRLAKFAKLAKSLDKKD